MESSLSAARLQSPLLSNSPPNLSPVTDEQGRLEGGSGFPGGESHRYPHEGGGVSTWNHTPLASRKALRAVNPVDRKYIYTPFAEIDWPIPWLIRFPYISHLRVIGCFEQDHFRDSPECRLRSGARYPLTTEEAVVLRSEEQKRANQVVAFALPLCCPLWT